MAGRILSTLTGTVVMGASATVADATVPTYDPTKSWVEFTHRCFSVATDRSSVRLEKFSSTVLRFERGAQNGTNAITIEWSIKTLDDTCNVQDELFTAAGNIAIDSVTQSESFIVSNGLFTTNADYGDGETFRASFVSATSINIDIGTGTFSGGVQVVSIPDAVVEEVDTTLTTGTQTDQTVTSVVSARTALYCTVRITADQGFDHTWRQTLLNDTTVRFNRYASGQSGTIVATTFVVQLPDTFNVYRGTETTPAPDTTDSFSFTAVVLNRSFVHWTTAAANPSLVSSDTTGDDYGFSIYAVVFGSTTTADMERETGSGNETLAAWEVIEDTSVDVIDGTVSLLAPSATTAFTGATIVAGAMSASAPAAETSLNGGVDVSGALDTTSPAAQTSFSGESRSRCPAG